ncbi:hypothetical protein PHMEG_00026106 [Phytophthora megakarya]|uniref:Integrase zinc-binding domain-containing protein n=1 Tax=Phytophthora megakarya TaxID=4795 RepID=A0A225V9D6_9STRA|nr:hypothetical protein PHMEG_00026106 [Phytophthora megakarya]
MDDVKRYVQSCATCVRFKSKSLKKNGTLMPLPVTMRSLHAFSTPKYAQTHSPVTAAQSAAIFFDVVVRRHGLLAAISNLRMTTTFRAQVDGQLDRQNRVMKDGLRCMVSIQSTNCSEVLRTVGYAHATLIHAST